MSTEIRDYWNQRAEENRGEARATTNDIHLRELEIKTFVDTLKELKLPVPAEVLDIGCGDGYSTRRIAAAFPGIHFTGIDFSEKMIELARSQPVPETDSATRVTFLVGDILDLDPVIGDSLFDVIMTDRCLINLTSFQDQARVLREISNHIHSGGYYIAIENFIEGQEKLNEARRSIDLPEIPVRWHNLFLHEREFVEAAGHYFSEITIEDFSSSYYFATRIIYSALCRKDDKEPDYDHFIHRFAPALPPVGDVSPIKLIVLRK